MISRETIHTAEARTAAHAAVFSIRCAEYDATPTDRPIARAIAAAALRRERAALDFAARRLETIRRYAAYEGIAGETRAAVQPFTPAAAVEMPATVEPTRVQLDARAVTCPRCAAAPGERCHKQGRPQTRNHDARTRAALLTSTPATVEPITTPRRSNRPLPTGRDTGRSTIQIIAREDAKVTPVELRTPAQNALIASHQAYRVLLTERYNLRQAENNDADAETLTALRSMTIAAEEVYNDLMQTARPVLDAMTTAARQSNAA